MKMLAPFVAPLALIAVFVAAPSSAVSPPQTSGSQSDASMGWEKLTKGDVEAAYQLLRDNHPAATQDAHDPSFIANLDRAYHRALSRAEVVRSMDGYTATLREFANSMGDGHIWSNPEFSRETMSWAGVIAARRGPDWIVAGEDKELVGTDILGARIVACDGEPIAEVAQNVMHFRSVTGDEAVQIMRAGRLLLDDGNPFLSRPKTCDFEQGGIIKSIRLNWQETSRGDLQKTYWKSAFGAAGFGLRPVAGGYWISIEALEPNAQPVIDQASSEAVSLRNAAYVVIDLRGNSGGDDAYGRKLADALYGPAYVESRLGPAASDCASVFRASPQNIDAVRKQIPVFQASGDTAAASEYTQALQTMEFSISKGAALTGSITCTAVAKTPSITARSLMHAPVFILSDVSCFSSCINAVGSFRKLGAVQIGQITGSDTHYAEVREVLLPSGLSTFSTLMALMPDAPAHIGPFVPSISYDGDISDTSALEAWIPAHALLH